MQFKHITSTAVIEFVGATPNEKFFRHPDSPTAFFSIPHDKVGRHWRPLGRKRQPRPRELSASR